MASRPIQSAPDCAKVPRLMSDHRLNTCSPLTETGIDAVHVLLPMIYSLSTLLEMGFRKETNGKSALDAANPELVASAFDGIAYLTALADFHARQA